MRLSWLSLVGLVAVVHARLSARDDGRPTTVAYIVPHSHCDPGKNGEKKWAKGKKRRAKKKKKRAGVRWASARALTNAFGGQTANCAKSVVSYAQWANYCSRT